MTDNDIIIAAIAFNAGCFVGGIFEVFMQHFPYPMKRKDTTNDNR